LKLAAGNWNGNIEFGFIPQKTGDLRREKIFCRKKTEERKMFEIKKPPNRTAGIRWPLENLFSEI
jgi:hypothetical protein